jgi:hypothetical protein
MPSQASRHNEIDLQKDDVFKKNMSIAYDFNAHG